jgi:hypothetical protein
MVHNSINKNGSYLKYSKYDVFTLQEILRNLKYGGEMTMNS